MFAAIIDYRYYPFLGDINSVLRMRYPGLRLKDVIISRENYARKRSLELLKTILSKRSIREGTGTSDEEIIAFYTLLLIIKVLNDKKLANVVALAYSKYAYEKLLKEPLNSLVNVAQLLGIDAKLERNAPLIPVDFKRKKPIFIAKPISMSVKDYLRFTANRLARDPKYALVNQIVDHGVVFLEKEVFVRVLEEAIYRKIIVLYNSIYEQELPEDLINEAKKVIEETGWVKQRVMDIELEEKAKGIIDFSAFPPCMSVILEKLKAGENLSHQERFAIAAFLARIGLDVDTILEYFKNVPDFNEKIARYQVEHIAGLRGSRKKYLPYNCETMRSLNICPVSDYCKGGKNPLAVYWFNVKRKILSKKKRGK
ncbi:MAG: DNA primase [Staphylothermus sp.]|nr:DNA primase [Staphylothermus sp.]